MTDQEVETAARHACKLLGLDPDGPAKFDGNKIIPNWSFVAPKVREQWAIGEGLKEVVWLELEARFAPCPAPVKQVKP